MKECVVCKTPATVRMELIRWRNEDPTFSTGWRCVDRLGCRMRVEGEGDTWPVDDPLPSLPKSPPTPIVRAVR